MSQKNEPRIDFEIKELQIKIKTGKRQINQHYETITKVDPHNSREIHRIQNKITDLKLRLNSLESENLLLLGKKRELEKSLHQTKINRQRAMNLQNSQVHHDENKKIHRILEMQRLSHS